MYCMVVSVNCFFVHEFTDMYCMVVSVNCFFVHEFTDIKPSQTF